MGKTYFIRGVDDWTKKRIKKYAKEHGITMAQALKEIIDAAREIINENKQKEMGSKL